MYRERDDRTGAARMALALYWDYRVFRGEAAISACAAKSAACRFVSYNRFRIIRTRGLLKLGEAAWRPRTNSLGR
jgi:hypothetical protein